MTPLTLTEKRLAFRDQIERDGGYIITARAKEFFLATYSSSEFIFPNGTLDEARLCDAMAAFAESEKSLTRMECSRIAALESSYWAGLQGDEKTLIDISIGATGAAANICAALFLEKIEEEYRKDISKRKGGEAA